MRNQSLAIDVLADELFVELLGGTDFAAAVGMIKKELPSITEKDALKSLPTGLCLYVERAMRYRCGNRSDDACFLPRENAENSPRIARTTRARSHKSLHKHK